MPLAFGGQFAKTIIERHEVEGRRSICRSRSKSVRGRKSGVAVDVERARKGAQKAADDAKNGPMKIVLIGPFGRGNHRMSGVDFKRFRMSS